MCHVPMQTCRYFEHHMGLRVKSEKTGEGGLQPVMLTRGRGDLWRTVQNLALGPDIVP